MTLNRLLRPRSIAVIGGGAVCENVVRRCREIGFAGPVWPVHPSRAEIGGERAFARIEDLPDAPDASFVGINRTATIEAMRALAARGAGGAVCYASGFAEAQAELGDGTALQGALLDAAGEMTVVGPNCYGFVNYLDRAALWPDIHGGRPVDRGVAIVTQSSNIAINLTMQRRGLPLAYMVTVGNQAQTGLSAIGMALLADARVTALGTYIEGVGDLRAFEALAAAARETGKPIVALKAGASDQSRAAAVSHTASLAGSSAGASALFDRLGVAEVATLPELLETLKLLHVTGPLPGARVASMSCSGGEASLMADLGQRLGIDYPPLGAAQRAALRAALGPKVALANPLDYHTYIWADRPGLEAAYGAMMQGDHDLGAIVLDFPRTDRCPDPVGWDEAVGAAKAVRRATGRPLAILASLPETMPEAVSDDLAAAGIAPLNGMAEGLAAIAAAARTGWPAIPAPLLLPGNADAARVLSEAEAKIALAGFGLDVPRLARAASPEEAAEAAQRLGFPVVLKGEGLAHKTEAGAVRLGLTSAEAVAEAARGMQADGFLVEEMIGDGAAELLIGVTADPAHGYVLTLAAGGTLTELLDDRAHLLLPATEGEVREALKRLRIAPVLAGYRGAAAADTQAIVAAVQALSAYVAASDGRAAEVEINPLICTPTRAVAADALIRTGETE